MDDPKFTDAVAPAQQARGAPSLLDRYEAIAMTSREMVDAARLEDWGEVKRLERDCMRQVRQLKSAARVQSLSPTDQAMRLRLLRSILADDAEIRRLAEPWLVELEHLLLPPPRGQAGRAPDAG
jgi:flagellar protein FliT